MTHELIEGGDLIGQGEAVEQVVIEVNAVLSAGFVQTGEGVAGTLSELSAGAVSELSLDDVIAHGLLAAIGVQWQIGSVQDP